MKTTDVPLYDLVRIHRMVTARKKAIESRHEIELAQSKEDLALVEGLIGRFLSAELEDNGKSSIRTPAGTAFYTTHDNLSIANPRTFDQWLLGDPKERFRILGRKISKSELKTLQGPVYADIATRVADRIASGDKRSPDVIQQDFDKLLDIPGVARGRFMKVNVRKA